MTKETNRITFFPNLDGLRFIAFFGVFLSHIMYTEDTHTLQSSPYTLLKFVFSHGALGVNFFFVLSGFLITYLLIQEKHDSGHIDLGYFYWKRSLRIWPVYYLVVIVGYFLFPFAQSLFGHSVQESNLLYYIFFVSNYLPEEPTNAILGVLWSISVEEQFYLFWPILLLVTPQDYFKHLFILVISISFILRSFFLEEVYMNTFSCISDLALGALIAHKVYTSDNIQKSVNGLTQKNIVMIYLCGIIMIFSLTHLQELNLIYKNRRFFYSVFFAFVIVEQVFSTNSFFKADKIPFLSRYGKRSYGLYMYHFIAIYLVNKSIDSLNTPLSEFSVIFVKAAISLVISLILCELSYSFFEKPILKFRNLMRSSKISI